MVNNKKKYIENRYLNQKQSEHGMRFFNGFHFQQKERIACPFSSFYPDPQDIKKSSDD
ncbi:hypothetical protein [Alkalibacillus aidingensis]|uniref:hypothetical protein n=1 Tax=Alkalibacillus aidingensis TaxID=2747607 RepID=UPI001660E5D0|nr:hypothetical protein [Alkalibacillus aidingensis]